MISNKKPYIHSRAVYFLAAFLNTLDPDHGSTLPALKFPRLALVFAEIQQGQYKTDILNKSPLPPLILPPTSSPSSSKAGVSEVGAAKTAGAPAHNPQIAASRAPALSDQDRAQMLSAPALPPDHGVEAKLLLREWHKSRGRQTRRDFVRSARAAASLDDAAFLRVLVQVVLDRADAAPTPAAADVETDALAVLLFTFFETFVFPNATSAQAPVFESPTQTLEFNGPPLDPLNFSGTFAEPIKHGPKTAEQPPCAILKPQTAISQAPQVHPPAASPQSAPGQRVCSLLKHFRALIGGILASHAHPTFHPRPAQRLLSRLLRLYRFEDHPADKTRTQALVLFIELLTHLQPLRAPAFAFSWLALLTDRGFLRPLLLITDIEYTGKCRFHTTRLLCAALAFMAPMLVQAWGRPFDEALRRFYAAALRTFTLLSRDHSAFVAEFYFDLAGAVPLRCVQMRNVVLSSVPPDAQSAGYFYGAVHSVLGAAPTVLPRWKDLLEACEANEFGPAARGLKPLLDEFLGGFLSGVGGGSPVPGDNNPGKGGHAPLSCGFCGGHSSESEFYRTVAAKLAAECGRGCRRELLAAAVAYVGFEALDEVRRCRDRRSKLSVAAALDCAFLFYVQLLRALGAEGKYCLVSSLVDHVRYHSPHTHLFSLAVLSVFGRSEEEEVREVTLRFPFRLFTQTGKFWK